MWFDTSMNNAWERGIKPGIEDSGYEPIRINEAEFNDRIDDEIIAAIRRSRFLVADFTQDGDRARDGFYYEAGGKRFAKRDRAVALRGLRELGPIACRGGRAGRGPRTG